MDGTAKDSLALIPICYVRAGNIPTQRGGWMLPRFAVVKRVRAWKPAVIVIDIGIKKNAPLAEIIDALSTLSAPPNGFRDGKQESREHQYDADDDQQFDERKSALI